MYYVMLFSVLGPEYCRVFPNYLKARAFCARIGREGYRAVVYPV
jgi:hypothetical protein